MLELLAHRHVKGVVPSRLVWKERGLFVGDPVYVLGPAEAAAGPPQSEGYRAGPSTQLVLRSGPASRLTIAAMTEEAYLARLKKGEGVSDVCGAGHPRRHRAHDPRGRDDGARL